MAADNIVRAYGDSSAKESVVERAITILTAQETSIYNMIGRSEAIALTHSFLVDTLDAAGTAAVPEADDYTAGAGTTPTRLSNVVEHIAKPFKVSRAQQRMQHYHGENELARQTKKKMLAWFNSCEFDLVRSTLVSGVSGTTPKMMGIIAAISKSTNTTAHTSGTVFSASILDGLMKGNWDNSNGDVATDLFVSSYTKQVIDTFTQKSNVVVNNPGGQTTIVRTVTTYETSAGTLRIHKHRYIVQSSDATDRILAIRPENLALAWFERPYVDTDLARSGPADFYAIAGSLTLETRNQDSNFFASGFLKA